MPVVDKDRVHRLDHGSVRWRLPFIHKHGIDEPDGEVGWERGWGEEVNVPYLQVNIESTDKVRVCLMLSIHSHTHTHTHTTLTHS